MYEPVAAPEKKLHMVETAYEKWSHHEVFLLLFFFLSNIQCCAKARSLLLSLYILFGKWEISEVFIETCKHA